MSKSFYHPFTLMALVAILLPLRARPDTTHEEKTPVLLELFTSEGCSSCPPADRLLRTLERQGVSGAEVIVLSEHVDYWDSLGWRDPFSNVQFSRRQSDYGRAFGTGGIYTPQMIVNGRVEFVGNDQSVATKEILRATARQVASVRLTPLGIETTEAGKSVATIQVTVDALPQMSKGDELEVMLALTETNLHSMPERGENVGSRLTHTGVVRTLVRAGKVDGPGFAAKARLTLDPMWNRSGLRAVAFAQEKKSRIVWGAAQTWLERPAH
jgi:hypothetical protein